MLTTYKFPKNNKFPKRQVITYKFIFESNLRGIELHYQNPLARLHEDTNIIAPATLLAYPPKLNTSDFTFILEGLTVLKTAFLIDL